MKRVRNNETIEDNESMQVSLLPMNEEAFSDYLQIAIQAYARDNVDSGRWDESDALERSIKEHEALLPEGVETKDNYLFNVVDNETSGNLKRRRPRKLLPQYRLQQLPGRIAGQSINQFVKLRNLVPRQVLLAVSL